MSVLLKVSQQTAWQLLSKAVTSLSTLFILSLVSQTYGETGTGVYTLALTYLAFFYMAVDLGLNAYLLPSLVKNESGVFQKLLGGRILISGVLVLISLALLPLITFNNPDYTMAVLFGSLTITSQGIFLTFQALYQAQFRYDLISKAMLVSTPITVGLIYLISQNQYPIHYLMLAHLSGWLVFIIISFGMVKNLTIRLTPLFDLKFIADSLKVVWPIALTLFLNTIYFRVDAFLLSYFHGFNQVGVYNFAYQFFQTALVVPTFIMNSYYPILIQNSKFKIQNLRKPALSMISLGILGTFATYLFSPFLINLIADGGFGESVKVLRILGIGFPGFFLSSLLMWVLISQKKFKTVLSIYTIGLLVNIVLNYLFIPGYSYVASAWITGATEYLILLMQAISLWSLVFRQKI